MKLFRLLPLLSCVAVYAQEESSSSAYLALPDSLTDELLSVAKSGFGAGFGIATAFVVGAGTVALFMHLINRGAGR